MKPKYMSWLIDTGERQTTACGHEIEIWSLDHQEDEHILSEWASQFRQNYIPDDLLPIMVDGTGKTKAQYLRDTVLPDAKNVPGPSLRSGDFGEIIVADFMEYILGYWSPRELRYQFRWNRNDSTKGCDVIGFKFACKDAISKDDELFIYETKSGAAATKANRLKDAVEDSHKDRLREGMTLNAIKRQFVERGAMDEVKRVQRFQNQADRPFRRVNGAAAILDEAVFATTNLAEIDASEHFNTGNLSLIVIRAPELMKLIHSLYEKAADES